MRGPLLLLMPAVLMAQRSALPPVEAFNRDLKQNRLGTWMVLEDEGAAWGALLRAALDEDPLVLLNLPLKVVGGGKKAEALAPHLRERFSWSKGAHWALVDAAGRILAEGAGAPTATALAAAAQQAGVRSRAQELEDFLRLNPDHLEAQVALLGERVRVANRRTLKLLGPSPEAPTAAQGGRPEPLRQLDAEHDLTFWSPVARQLDQLFQGAWREAGIELGVALRVSSAEHSPSMQALLARYRIELEETLRRRPNGVEPWFLWLAASRKCGGWPLLPLLQSLEPLPGTAPGEWPPMLVLKEFIEDAKARRDWRAIREVLEARWESLRSSGDTGWGGDGLWNVVIGPLLEALVTLGEAEAAEQTLNEVNMAMGWPGLPGRARDLATRLNRPELALRWGALTPKGR